MNLSYWEIKRWFKDVDFVVIGSGIVGLHTAIFLKEKYPKAKVVVLEKGNLPEGASTKNAGFACFGSLSEIIDDLSHHSPKEVVDLVRQRWEGLRCLRELGDAQIGYQGLGGYELIKSSIALAPFLDQLPVVNELLFPVFKKAVFQLRKNGFGFNGVHDTLIFNALEGQIDTGKMMGQLLTKAWSLNIQIMNNCKLLHWEDSPQGVQLETSMHSFQCKRLCITTNGFAAELMNEAVQPARAQILLTEPIPNLPFKGTFHFDAGYYYFRNIDQRILLGGGRNLDLKGEETTKFGLTANIQMVLETLLNEVILPGKNVDIDYRWSGIMGVGKQKKPIVKSLSQNVYCGVRLGGMGIAIGANVAKALINTVTMD